jgi:hypothetical protein
MMLTGENRNTQTETCPSASFLTQNPIWSGVGSNLVSEQPRADLSPDKKKHSGPAQDGTG